MAANSAMRRVLKRVLFPLLPRRAYVFCQSVAMALDIRFGALEEPELALVPIGVHEGETVLDVGANFGLYSYHFSRAVGRTGKVYAFEPIPFTCSVFRLVARWLRLRNVELVPKGCGDRAETVVFRVPLQTSGALTAGLSHMGSRRDDAPGGGPDPGAAAPVEVDCEIVVLDEVLSSVEGLSFIKCDVEGAELLAFRGARRLIERHRPTVCCEVNPRFLQGFGFRPDDLFGFFAEAGYESYRLDRGPTLHRTGPSDVGDGPNVVFIHPDRASRFSRLQRKVEATELTGRRGTN